MENQAVHLAFNLANRETATGECNPGGSWICWSPTRGCKPGGPMTCFGTSTKPKAIEAMVSIPAGGELEGLHKELAEIVAKYAAADTE